MSNIVVSVTIHEDMNVNKYIYVNVYECVFVYVYVQFFFVLSGPDIW